MAVPPLNIPNQFHPNPFIYLLAHPLQDDRIAAVLPCITCFNVPFYSFQVPHIAMYCQEMKSSYLHVVPQYLLPMVVKFLTDMNNQAIHS